MTSDGRQHLHVTCAIIERDGLVLAAQRGSDMSLPYKWEFPGGKIAPGESQEECLQRELQEELGIQICIVRKQATVAHHYPQFSVTLYPFVCNIEAGEIILHEHAAIVWLPPDLLHDLDWAEADLPVIEAYLAELRSGSC